jgi:hypothetical protein
MIQRVILAEYEKIVADNDEKSGLTRGIGEPETPG